MQGRLDDTNWSIDEMLAGRNAADVGKRSNQPDRPVTAHAKIADVVEEDHSGDTRTFTRRNEQRPDHHVRPARLVYNGGTELIVLLLENSQSRQHRSLTEFGPAIRHD